MAIEIQFTSDISVWRFPSWQRPDRTRHQWNLAEKMLEGGYDEGRPIVLVYHDGDDKHQAGLYVVDGRQRTGAAKKIQEHEDPDFEVAYIVVAGDLYDEQRWLSLGSDQANWTMEDHMHFYADHGYDAYQWASWLCERYDFMTPAGVARIAQGIGSLGSQYRGKEKNSKAWKRGGFAPSQKFKDHTVRICGEVERLAEHMEKIDTSEGMASYMTVRAQPNFDFDRMEHAAKRLGSRFRLMPKRKETVELLIHGIYNHNLGSDRRLEY